MKLLFLLASALLIATACKKKGCTDSLAKNYDKEVEKTNNTCTYDASVIFWINASSSINLKNNMINSLNIYVDSSKIGQMGTSSSQLETPNCNTVGITHLLDLASLNSTSIAYKITHDGFGLPGSTNEITYAEGMLQLDGGRCTPFLIQ